MACSVDLCLQTDDAFAVAIICAVLRRGGKGKGVAGHASCTAKKILKTGYESVLVALRYSQFFKMNYLLLRSGLFAKVNFLKQC